MKHIFILLALASALRGEAEKRELALKLSPLELLRAGNPAILVAHGDADPIISFRNAIALHEAAVAKGVPVECIISKGAGHGFSGEAIDPSVAEINRRTVEFSSNIWSCRESISLRARSRSMSPSTAASRKAADH